MYLTEVIEQQIDHKRKRQNFTFAVLGNPNSGKSTVFNQLTGLRQKIGNFPGVTVDKKLGKVQLDSSSKQTATLIDFPGTYSFYPTSQDERIVVQTFTNTADENFPDAVIYVADVSKLEKHLLLFSQVCVLGLPMILVLNMADVAEKEGIAVDTNYLSEKFAVPVVAISGRARTGFDMLKLEMLDIMQQEVTVDRKIAYPLSDKEKQVAATIKESTTTRTDFQAVLLAHHYDWLPFLQDEQRKEIATVIHKAGFVSLRQQVEETMHRFDTFTPIVQKAIRKTKNEPSTLTEKLDAILMHGFLGPIIFFALMILVFQSIFAWATYPMDLIESIFAEAGYWVKYALGSGLISSLIADGILAGLGGVLVFIPQIAILFFLISLLEEVGYMARVAYIFDKVMQSFGMNGRSVVALISSGACAIPAIMSTRTISNWKERLITIMVTPMISCSARIPVYIVLIGFVVPASALGGWGQGVAMMGLYILGILGVFISALVFKFILKTKEHSFLMLELPEYRTPMLRNVGLTVWEKVKSFVTEAGKIIIFISIILWGLASFGPAGKMAQAEAEAMTYAHENKLSAPETRDLIAARQIEVSYAGMLGKTIEPAIRPLGFDWKIGIALITSFAAREVFVGTMATIYSIGSVDDEYSIRNKMAKERNAITGEPVYNLASALSLLVFYVFAMQCMSTLAVVKRETKSWKWPIIQFTFMSALAYLSSLFVYQLLS